MSIPIFADRKLTERSPQTRTNRVCITDEKPRREPPEAKATTAQTRAPKGIRRPRDPAIDLVCVLLRSRGPRPVQDRRFRFAHAAVRWDPTGLPRQAPVGASGTRRSSRRAGIPPTIRRASKPWRVVPRSACLACRDRCSPGRHARRQQVRPVRAPALRTQHLQRVRGMLQRRADANPDHRALSHLRAAARCGPQPEKVGAVPGLLRRHPKGLALSLWKARKGAMSHVPKGRSGDGDPWPRAKHRKRHADQRTARGDA